MTTAPRFAGIGGHHGAKAKTDEWLTPRWVQQPLGAFTLDPASPVVRPWDTAERHYTREDNGLLKPWFGRVWLNPPYSRPLLSRFMARMAAHDEGIALIFARTETDTFHRYVWQAASAVFFFAGRITFCTPDGKPAVNKHGHPANGGAPNVLCAYGQHDADVLAFCGLEGQFVPLRLPGIFALGGISEQSWREAVAAWLSRQDGPVRLDDIYRAFAHHPKARRNPHWRDKIRQVLQLGAGERVDRGIWRAAC